MGDDVLRYLPLHRAALTDDWETAEAIFKQYPDADTAKITYRDETALHIAVGTNCSHHFVGKLVNRIVAKDITKLRTTTNDKNINSLHYAATVGNTKAAKVLVENDREMTIIPNGLGSTAIKLAAWYGRKETLVYLLGVTPNQVGVDGTSPYSGVTGGDLITQTITAGFYDITLELMRRYPNLITQTDRYNHTSLEILAAQWSDFPSGRSWWFWKYLIYFCYTVVTLFNTPINNTIETALDVNLNSEKNSSHTWMETPCSKGTYGCFKYTLVQNMIVLFFPFLKNMHDTKLVHKQTNQLMKFMIRTILNEGSPTETEARDALGPAMFIAAKHGIHEIIEECLGRYPGLIWYTDNDGANLFLAAIKHRQVKVYNLVYQMTGHVVFLAKNTSDGDNALHLAGRKVQHRLNTVTGAALQMQRELQWFKEVEKFVAPSYKEAPNKESKTPRMVFTDEHKDLVEKGEKWMKDTASSSTLVAALIVTVSFAAIFTLPGVNKSDGTPNFLSNSTFVLFAISDAVALFSSVTSVLLFLAMLTSRYAEDAFLHALPKRLTIGLLSLFISILAIMLTFSAALVLVLRKKVSWIAIPVGLIACVPVTFFALLQFPLLVELVLSTYGPSIFHKQNNLILH
ncbi:hypothetical protein QQ045_012261 [Rhodiola kirilowii]